MTSTKRQRLGADTFSASPFPYGMYLNIMLAVCLALLWLADPSWFAGKVFSILFLSAFLAVLGMLCYAMLPSINPLALTHLLTLRIKGSTALACMQYFDEEELRTKDEPAHTITLTVPNAFAPEAVPMEVWQYLESKGFKRISIETVRDVAVVTKMLYRKRMILYGISCMHEPYGVETGMTLHIISIKRQVG